MQNHIFLNCTWTILQDRVCTKPPKKLNKVKWIDIIQRMFPDKNKIKLEIIKNK